MNRNLIRPSSRRLGVLAAVSLSFGLHGCAQLASAQPAAAGQSATSAAPESLARARGMSPEAAAQRADRLLDGLGVADADRARIRQIVQAAAADLASQREAGRQLHQQSMRLFAAPQVDAAAAEQLRQQMLAQHDRMTRRRLQALLDISAILTPEQRAGVLQRLQQRGGHRMHHGGYQGMHHGQHHGQHHAEKYGQHHGGGQRGMHGMHGDKPHGGASGMPAPAASQPRP